MLKLISAPATNEPGPRYVETALAAIHQANRGRRALEYGLHQGRVALFVRLPEHLDEIVAGPILANYPNCSMTTADEGESIPHDWETWTAELELTPELFPILRHAQFEDLLNRNFADPVSGILRPVKPDEHRQCRIEIRRTPAQSAAAELHTKLSLGAQRGFFAGDSRAEKEKAPQLNAEELCRLKTLLASF